MSRLCETADRQRYSVHHQRVLLAHNRIEKVRGLPPPQVILEIISNQSTAVAVPRICLVILTAKARDRKPRSVLCLLFPTPAREVAGTPANGHYPAGLTTASIALAWSHQLETLPYNSRPCLWQHLFGGHAVVLALATVDPEALQLQAALVSWAALDKAG